MTITSAFGDATTRVKVIEDLTDDDYGIIRKPDGPRVEIAVAPDGTTEGVIEAEACPSPSRHCRRCRRS